MDTLAQEWTEKDVDSTEDALSEAVWPKVGSSHSIPSKYMYSVSLCVHVRVHTCMCTDVK